MDSLNLSCHKFCSLIDFENCHLDRCGEAQETAYHYVMECTLYDEQCLQLMEEVTLIYPFEFKTLMHGHKDLSYEDNRHVVKIQV